MYLPCRNKQFLRVFLICVCLISFVTVFHAIFHAVPKQELPVDYIAGKSSPYQEAYNNVGEYNYADREDNLNYLFKEILDETQDNQDNLESESPEEEADEWILENENIPDLPMLLESGKNGPKYFNPGCANFPNLYTIQFSNIHWQIQETLKETYFFYSAYLDVRGRIAGSNDTSDYIRVLGMSDGGVNITLRNISLKVCQFWFHNQTRPTFGKITDVKLLWRAGWGKMAHYFPYLISCRLPSNVTTSPFSVSLVESPCDHATNNLNILHEEQATLISRNSSWSPPFSFGVCVKALDFPDKKMRYRLMEWIETLRLMGADKIFFYEYFVNSDIKQVLNYYESRRIIDVAQITLPGELPNQPQLRHLYIRGKKLDKRLTELIPYNDCLYRHMYGYKYLAVVDTDELIIPSDGHSWESMMSNVIIEDVGLQNLLEPVSTFCFRNYYFLDGMLTPEKDSEVTDIPPEFHMLRHIYRATNHTMHRYMKCFHDTRSVLGVHNHFPFYCIDNGRPKRGKMYGCVRHFVDTDRAKMHHYRDTCVAEIKNCSEYQRVTNKDTTLWQYKEQLMSRVKAVLLDVTN